jgi:hypothetical protein
MVGFDKKHSSSTSIFNFLFFKQKRSSMELLPQTLIEIKEKRATPKKRRGTKPKPP